MEGVFFHPNTLFLLLSPSTEKPVEWVKNRGRKKTTNKKLWMAFSVFFPFLALFLFLFQFVRERKDKNVKNSSCGKKPSLRGEKYKKRVERIKNRGYEL